MKNRYRERGLRPSLNAEAAVNAKVKKAAAKKFEALGATLGEVSVPMDLLGPGPRTPIARGLPPIR